jgi:hypothetical protein
MTIATEIKKWKLTKYKLIHLIIGIAALLLYEFIARPYYRPYIYSNKVNDFHIADTLGNTLGTLAMIFIMIFLLSNNKEKSNFIIKNGTLIMVVYELAQPLLGKPIDPWDILATLLTGATCYFIMNFVFKERLKKKTENQLS